MIFFAATIESDGKGQDLDWLACGMVTETNALEPGFLAIFNSAPRVASVIRLGKTAGLSTPGSFVFLGRNTWPCKSIAPRLNFRFRTPV